MAASMYTNRIHRDTVGRQTPLSACKQTITNNQHSWNVAVGILCIDVCGKDIKRGLTCVPDILDPYVGAGGKKQPLDRDE